MRRVLVKAEMEKFLQNKELYNNLKRGKVMEWNSPHCCFLLCCVYSKLTQDLCVCACACVCFSGLLLLQSEVPSLLMAIHLPTV